VNSFLKGFNMYEHREYAPTLEALQEGVEAAMVYEEGHGHRWSDGANPCPALRMAVVDKLISEEDCQKIIDHGREGLPMEFCRAPSTVSWYLIDVMEYLDRVFECEKYPFILNKTPVEVAEILTREI